MGSTIIKETLWRQRLPKMRCRSHGVAHVVQTVKERDQIEILLRILLSRRHLKSGVRNNTMLAGVRSGLLDRPRMEVVTNEITPFINVCLRWTVSMGSSNTWNYV